MVWVKNSSLTPFRPLAVTKGHVLIIINYNTGGGGIISKIVESQSRVVLKKTSNPFLEFLSLDEVNCVHVWQRTCLKSYVEQVLNKDKK